MDLLRLYHCFILLYVTSSERTVLENEIRKVGENIEQYMEQGLGYSEFQEYIDNLQYDTAQPITSDTAKEIADSISDKLRRRVNALKGLQREIQNEWSRVSDLRSGYELCSEIALGETSTVHNTPINRDTWCIAGKELYDTIDNANGDFEFLPDILLNNFKEVVDQDTDAVKRVYFGSERGVLTTYPASRLFNDFDNHYQFDPRFQSWYVTTATPNPKDVVLVVDRSASMSSAAGWGQPSLMAIAKKAAETVLQTLSPNDRVGVVVFSDETHIITDSSFDVDGCYAAELAKATPTVITTLIDFINSISPRGSTVYSNALDKAFQYFNETDSDPNDSRKREKVILLLSDGKDLEDSVDEIMRVIAEGNSRIQDKVVIFTYGIGEIGDALHILEAIARQNFTSGEIKEGRFTLVRNLDNLRYEMANYYDYFKSTEGIIEEQYTVPYLDDFDTGLQISICLQVVVNSELKGIVCMDLPLEYIVSEIEYYRKGELSYGFIMDAQVRVMTHPLLPHPKDVHSNVAYTHLSTLESGNKLDELVDRMVRRENGSLTMTPRRVVARGNVDTEGVSALYVNSVYYFYPIAHTKFSLCIVTASDQPTPASISIRNWVGSAESPGFPEFLYHKDLGQDEPKRKLCRAATRVGSSDLGCIKLAPRAFKNSLNYLVRNETREDAIQYKEYFMGTREDDRFKSSVRETAAVVHRLNDLFAMRTEHRDQMIWRFLGTEIGVTFTYPGVELPTVYDAVIRPWYKRSVYHHDKIVLTTPYIDAFGAGTVMSITKAVYDGSTQRQGRNSRTMALGVIGLDLSFTFAYHLITRDLPACSPYTCFVINESGFIVVHKKWIEDGTTMVEDIHMATMEGAIAAKMEQENILNHEECVNIDRITTQICAKISLLNHMNNYYEYPGWFEIMPIYGTNLFLIVKKSVISLESLSCSCHGNQVAECATNYDCTCPCFDETDLYDYCAGVFQLGNDEPPPCTPPIPSIDWSSITPINHELVDQLDYCHDYKCQDKINELDCRSTLTCAWCIPTGVEGDCIASSTPSCVAENQCSDVQEPIDCTTQAPQELKERKSSSKKKESFPLWSIAIIIVGLLLCVVIAIAAVVIVKQIRKNNAHRATTDDDPYLDITTFHTQLKPMGSTPMVPRSAYIRPDGRYLGPPAAHEHGAMKHDGYITAPGMAGNRPEVNQHGGRQTGSYLEPKGTVSDESGMVSDPDIPRHVTMATQASDVYKGNVGGAVKGCLSAVPPEHKRDMDSESPSHGSVLNLANVDYENRDEFV